MSFRPRLRLNILGSIYADVRSVRMGVPNAQKTDGSELRNTLDGMEHGKGAESAEQSEEKGEMRNVCRRSERLGLSLCAVPSPRGIWGSFNLRTEQSLWNNEGIVSGVMTQAQKWIRTEY